MNWKEMKPEYWYSSDFKYSDGAAQRFLGKSSVFDVRAYRQIMDGFKAASLVRPKYTWREYINDLHALDAVVTEEQS